MNRYLRLLGDMQRKCFKARTAYMDVDTSVGIVAGQTVTHVKAWATIITPNGKKSLRIDILSNDEERESEIQIQKLIKFINLKN